jgi:hypothetical protein
MAVATFDERKLFAISNPCARPDSTIVIWLTADRSSSDKPLGWKAAGRANVVQYG